MKNRLRLITSLVFIALLSSCEPEPLPSDDGETYCWQFYQGERPTSIIERLTEVEKDLKIQELDANYGAAPVYSAVVVSDVLCE